jgi:hypothetical protein
MNQSGYSGYVCPVGDLDHMVIKTLDLIKDENRLSKFKTQALDRAKSFDIGKVLPIYEELYSRALTKIHK